MRLLELPCDLQQRAQYTGARPDHMYGSVSCGKQTYSASVAAGGLLREGIRNRPLLATVNAAELSGQCLPCDSAAGVDAEQAKAQVEAHFIARERVRVARESARRERECAKAERVRREAEREGREEERRMELAKAGVWPFPWSPPSRLLPFVR